MRPLPQLDILETRRLFAYTFSAIPFTSANGASPQGGLIADSAGNLYGVAANGGAFDRGTIYKIPAGTNTITPLASFTSADGKFPRGQLVLDTDGNLYGTTLAGGTDNAGTIFKLTPGATTITTLASFDGDAGSLGDSGSAPDGTLLLAPNGFLYATASTGGQFNHGAIVRVPKAGGPLVTLAAFNNANGSTPDGTLLLVGDNLVGTTRTGGTSGPTSTDSGTIWSLPANGGSISQTFPFKPDGSTGTFPTGGLISDSTGALYGVTAATGSPASGSNFGAGTVFKYDNGQFTQLATFDDTTTQLPQGGLVRDADGNLFGVTSGTGANNSFGTVFQIKPGESTPITLYTVTNGSDGQQPSARLYLAPDGTLYGTTLGGGNFANSPGGDGVVFALHPEPGVEATHLAFTAAPTTGVANTLLPDNFTVTFLDASNNPVTSETSSVTLTISSGATLGGTTTVPAINGVATFSNLFISAPGTYTISASSGSLTSATTTITISPSTTPPGNGILTPAFVSTTLTSPIVTGVKFKPAAIKFTLSNNSDADNKGYSVALFASADSIIDDSDIRLASLTKSTTIKAGKTINVSLSIKSIPDSLAQGAYTLGLQSTDAASNKSTIAIPTPNPLLVQAPIVTLDATLTSTLPAELFAGQKTKATITLLLTNIGNTDAIGNALIDLSASTTPNTTGTPLQSLTKRVTLKKGKPFKISIPIKSAPNLPAGTYHLTARIVPPQSTAATIVSAPNTFTLT